MRTSVKLVPCKKGCSDLFISAVISSPSSLKMYFSLFLFFSSNSLISSSSSGIIALLFQCCHMSIWKNAVKVWPVLLGSGAILCPVAFCQLNRFPLSEQRAGGSWHAGPCQAALWLPTSHRWASKQILLHVCVTRPQLEWQSGHRGRPAGHCGSWGWAVLTGPKC